MTAQPPRVIAYIVREEGTAYKLTETAKKLMEAGWQPYGGVSTYMRPGGILGPNPCYSQAFVKYAARPMPVDEGGPL